MSAQELLREKREDILRVAAEHGASNVRLFGSVARGDDTPESDIDFLVDMERERSLLDLVRLLSDLEALLQRSVDVMTVPGLRDRIRETVLKEAAPL
jgi:predicted nucleotidyltransferase